jgi:hypothetical protein
VDSGTTAKGNKGRFEGRQRDQVSPLLCFVSQVDSESLISLVARAIDFLCTPQLSRTPYSSTPDQRLSPALFPLFADHFAGVRGSTIAQSRILSVEQLL